jgi:uncharacterized RDD family membrane protein YckC
LFAAGGTTARGRRQAEQRQQAEGATAAGDDTWTDNGGEDDDLTDFAIEQAQPAPAGEGEAGPEDESEKLWYYAIDGNAVGPVSRATLSRLSRSGQFGPETLVWRSGWEDWAPLEETSLQQRVKKENPGQHSKAVARETSPDGRDAGFWLRAIALMIDVVIQWILVLTVGFAVGFVLAILMGAEQMQAIFWRQDSFGRVEQTPFGAVFFLALQIAIPWLYYALCEASAGMATPGKRALGLIVTTAQGQQLSFARATGRYFGKFISGLLLGIGFLMAAFTQRKQALHDMMAETLVMQR